MLQILPPNRSDSPQNHLRPQCVVTRKYPFRGRRGFLACNMILSKSLTNLTRLWSICIKRVSRQGLNSFLYRRVRGKQAVQCSFETVGKKEMAHLHRVSIFKLTTALRSEERRVGTERGGRRGCTQWRNERMYKLA